MRIREVMKQHEGELLRKANVVGVMTGFKRKAGAQTDQMSIVCMVEKKIAEKDLRKRDLVPESLEGFKTDVIQVGRLKALMLDKKARYRPCPMGTSGGHYKITAGTNGELLIDKSSGKTCIGTNNHVGANSNDAIIGDPYLQPGPYDGGTVQRDTIGHLLRYVPLEFAGEPSECRFARFWSALYNYPSKHLQRMTRLRPVVAYAGYNAVDAAMIEVYEYNVGAEIVDIGIPIGIKEAELDMLVQKSGRTSCHTVDGLVTGVDATIGPVSYGSGRSAYFKDQIVITKEGFSAGGDSGSLVLDMDGYAVGKLFAGSDTENITIANHIQKCLALLNADLVTE